MNRNERPVVLSVGSNQGDRLRHLQAALDGLRGVDGLTVTEISSVYETEPWGEVEQGDFLNLVVLGTTTLAGEELLADCLAIEDANGRERAVKWGPRTLDIDIVTLGDDLVDTPHLHLPHPRARERAFVIIPWLEVDPIGVLPGWGPLREIADGFDAAGVEKRDDLTERLRGERE